MNNLKTILFAGTIFGLTFGSRPQPNISPFSSKQLADIAYEHILARQNLQSSEAIVSYFQFILKQKKEKLGKGFQAKDLKETEDDLYEAKIQHQINTFVLEEIKDTPQYKFYMNSLTNNSNLITEYHSTPTMFLNRQNIKSPW